MASHSIGIHTTKTGKQYNLQYDPDGRFAQAVLVRTGAGPRHLVLAFRAESKQEALRTLVEELDKGPY